MKVTYNWLKDYVDFDWTPEELAERLTMLGLEVESLERTGNEFDGIVVAQVLAKEKHPNADKLSLCRVNDGTGERQIVCGAQNFQAGDKVPLALAGCSLSGGGTDESFTIKVGKIRGIKSEGMMCSGKELGLSEDHAGLMILPSDATVGQPFAEHLGREPMDVVLDLEITPNRPDLNSLIGIAREIAALTGNALRTPTQPDGARDDATPAQAPTTEELVAVRLEDPALCPRYTARVIQGIKIGTSPDWLRHRLEMVGIRSINNIVDATNYVLMETGHPLHAFDFHRLVVSDATSKPTIVVRRASAGENFTTLDDNLHELTGEMLVIADEDKAIALAGVMGGRNTEISESTTDVLLESAYFQPTNIRRTSKHLGLRTDASYRFERGADIGIADSASLRCAQLIQELAGGNLVEGVVDAYPEPAEERKVSLRPQRVSQLLGIQITPEEIDCHLSQLGLTAANRAPQPVAIDATPDHAPAPLTYRIPTFRVDLKREIDLIEEVVRLHGIDKIPSTPPRGAIGANAFDAVHDSIAEARHALISLGLDEAQGQTLIAGAAAERVTSDLVRLAHPLSSDMDVLRPSLLPGLLDALKHNLNHQNLRVALFEVGRVFTPQTPHPGEERRIGLALTGPRYNSFWAGSEREALYDIYDLKGVLETFLLQYGVRGTAYARIEETSALFLESARLTVGRNSIGEMGQLLPNLAKQYDLRDPVYLAELRLDTLLSIRTLNRSFRALPIYPSTRRDLAMVLPESVSHDAVLREIKKAKAKNLESVELFDVFRGKNIPDGQKSVAYAFTYRHAERTLKDKEVSQEQERVMTRLRGSLGATIREA